MRYTIACTIEDESKAGRVVHALKLAGFQHTDISVLMPDRSGVRDLAQEQKGESRGNISSKAAPVICGHLGWLSTIGEVMVPGIGAVLAAGPIVSSLSKLTDLSSECSVRSGLGSLGLLDDEAMHYEDALRNGNIFMSIHTDQESDARNAEEIFRAQGGNDIKCASWQSE